jgi:hypothetical protein
VAKKPRESQIGGSARISYNEHHLLFLPSPPFSEYIKIPIIAVLLTLLETALNYYPQIGILISTPLLSPCTPFSFHPRDLIELSNPSQVFLLPELYRRFQEFGVLFSLPGFMVSSFSEFPALHPPAVPSSPVRERLCTALLCDGHQT